MDNGPRVHWFPGHMQKTRRQIREDLKLVDIILELLDARIPKSSRNPDIADITAGKPRIVLLNKCDLADVGETARWVDAMKAEGTVATPVDCASGAGVAALPKMIRGALDEKIKRDAGRGMSRPLRAMVLGVPNVGKSSLINRLGKNKKAKVEDRPGVTRARQWVVVSDGLELMDTPGVLWPRFDDPETGRALAFTGAVKDEVFDVEDIAALLLRRLMELAPGAVAARYGVDEAEAAGDPLGAVAGKRGFMLRGAQPDYERAARVVLDEYRGGVIGKFTLERPE